MVVGAIFACLNCSVIFRKNGLEGNMDEHIANG